MPKRVLILGSTGSIGVQALDVIAAEASEFEIVGLTADKNWQTLFAQANKCCVKTLVLADQSVKDDALANVPANVDVSFGPEAIIELILETSPDLVLNALVGAAGLGPSVATLGEGIDLALANKESLVVGGELVMQLAEATGARLLPVDSEHSAIWQLIEGELADKGPGTVESFTLTASGGPFRGRSRAELSQVTAADALKHPTWDMGGKISIDSATLMNKGLEVIEAHHLFQLPYDKIGVVVHPESIIHSVVNLNDGATLAHLGHPDMRAPIGLALHYPTRAQLDLKRLNLAEVGSLTFEKVDQETFGCLRLAREAGQAGGTAPCILNAANEVAVYSFLNGEIGFLAIQEVVEKALEKISSSPVRAFNQLFDVDREAREVAAAICRGYLPS